MKAYSDEIFMREALVEAKKGGEKGEVPVGAVVVFAGKIIARGHNFIEAEADASMHAEINCLRMVAKARGNWRLSDCTLYCTLEPCAMCAGAMLLFRLKRLVYGAPDLRHGALEILLRPHPIHSVAVKEGVCADDAAHLMRDFFRRRRRENVATRAVRSADRFARRESL